MDVLTLYRQHRAQGVPAHHALAWARRRMDVAHALDALDIDRYTGKPEQWHGTYADTWRADLAAEGWQLVARIVADDEPYDPGDCTNPDGTPYTPEEVWGVVAEVLDPAGNVRGHDALWGIDSDGTADGDAYVLDCLWGAIEEACASAGVAPNPAEEMDQ